MRLLFSTFANERWACHSGDAAVMCAATVARPYPQTFEASGIRYDAVPPGWRILGGDANIDYKELLQ